MSGGYASAERGLRHVFLRGMVLPARIGVHAHEHGRTQRVRITLDLAVDDPGARDPALAVGADDLARVVDYQAIVGRMRDIVTAGHVRLAETLAERIAATCLRDNRVKLVRVSVEKLDVFTEADSVGVTVERHNP